jgi:hypothetical protein
MRRHSSKGLKARTHEAAKELRCMRRETDATELPSLSSHVCGRPAEQEFSAYILVCGSGVLDKRRRSSSDI